MTAAFVVRLATGRPDDVGALASVPPELLRGVRAVAGKTEGNGCVNDFSRALASLAWAGAIPTPVVTVMSGGTEGVLSPHVTLLGHRPDNRPADGPAGGLALGTAVTPVIPPSELGRRPQVDTVADAVREACRAGGFPPSSAELVLVKCPLLTSDVIAERADEVITHDTYDSMARSRAAAALGVAAATGELDGTGVDAGLAGDTDRWSSVASTSAGAEVSACHVVVLGNAPAVHSRLRASHAVMADAIDAASVQALLAEVDAAGGRVVQVFAKAEASPDGAVRGRRHTMLTDSDIHATRHARAAVGGLLAGLVGEPAIYVSGGAEHQGPPGGGPVTVVWELG